MTCDTCRVSPDLWLVLSSWLLSNSSHSWRTVSTSLVASISTAECWSLDCILSCWLCQRQRIYPFTILTTCSKDSQIMNENRIDKNAPMMMLKKAECASDAKVRKYNFICTESSNSCVLYQGLLIIAKYSCWVETYLFKPLLPPLHQTMTHSLWNFICSDRIWSLFDINHRVSESMLDPEIISV